jgi:uncharacterized membrane-anchored protein YhcB (DUF1043 family)
VNWPEAIVIVFVGFIIGFVVTDYFEGRNRIRRMELELEAAKMEAAERQPIEIEIDGLLDEFENPFMR